MRPRPPRQSSVGGLHRAAQSGSRAAAIGSAMHAPCACAQPSSSSSSKSSAVAQPSPTTGRPSCLRGVDGVLQRGDARRIAVRLADEMRGEPQRGQRDALELVGRVRPGAEAVEAQAEAHDPQAREDVQRAGRVGAQRPRAERPHDPPRVGAVGAHPVGDAARPARCRRGRRRGSASTGRSAGRRGRAPAARRRAGRAAGRRSARSGARPRAARARRPWPERAAASVPAPRRR